MPSFHQIDISDPLYRGELLLRDAVLRSPQGRHRTAADLDRDRTGFHFVAVDAGNVIGCIGLYPHADGALEMRHVAVDPARRREGLATSILRVAEDWARGAGYRTIVVEARTSALAFYVACGYAEESDDYLKHGIPHCRMRKPLNG